MTGPSPTLWTAPLFPNLHPCIITVIFRKTLWPWGDCGILPILMTIFIVVVGIFELPPIFVKMSYTVLVS